MDSEKIDELLGRYWNCETSLEEEQLLREYLCSGNIPEHLTETANLFRYFDAQKNISLTDTAFEGQVMKKIQSRPKGKMRTMAFNTMRIAAGIAVLIAAVWLVRLEIRESGPAEMADTYNDPKMAFEETKKALMMISKSFGTAEEQAKKINLFNEAQKDIRKKETKPEQ
jgi:hypothetical protein